MSPINQKHEMGSAMPKTEVKPLHFTFKNQDYYSHAYTTNAALTLFYNKSVQLKVGATLNALYQCVPFSAIGKQNDNEHAEFHQSSDDIDTTHTHLLKPSRGNMYYERLTPTELKCFLEQMKIAGENPETCEDKTHNCIISDEDIAGLNKAYEKYYRRIEKAGTPKAQIDPFYHQLRAYSTAASRSLIANLVNTLLDHYFLPAMKQAGYSLAAQKAVKFSVSSLLTAMLLGSFANIPLNVFVEALDHAFDRLTSENNNYRSIRKIASNLLLTTFTFWTNPENKIASLIGASSGAVVGAAMGHLIINALPKLREEPVAENQPETTSIERPTPASLRRRSPGH